MVTFPPCKINLGLHVLSKRADGYHNLETCFYPVPWTDILEIIPATQTTFAQTGIPIPGAIDSNLCLRAYHLLEKAYDLPPVSIHLHKVIPLGAGLGGGSANAAFTLRLLNDLFALSLNSAQLQQFASQLGSDCAFFIFDKPMLGSGRGEILEPVALSLTETFLVLVKPDIHISTAEAYAGVTPSSKQQALTEILSRPMDTWRQCLINDFEASVFKKNPQLEEIKNQLYQQGAWYAAMSGSGATVFGLFNQPVDISIEFPDCTYWGGVLT
jgi:4-diphosphocytidyl-2-C-methyl-D-erythritol kinase